MGRGERLRLHEDLEFIEEHGCMAGAKPDCVSDFAKKRQQDEMGTLGSGNHYLEVQQVVRCLMRRWRQCSDFAKVISS